MASLTTWPVLRHPDGRPPLVSSGWGSPRKGHTHKGGDVMFKRPTRVSKFVAALEQGTTGYEMKRGTPIVAAGDGVVTYVRRTLRGVGIIIDHGTDFNNDRWQTFYQHLEDSSVKKGQKVIAGQVIGVGGHGLLSAIRHLHFEIWKNGHNPVDPCGGGEGTCKGGIMGHWQILSRPTAGFTPMKALIVQDSRMVLGIGLGIGVALLLLNRN